MILNEKCKKNTISIYKKGNWLKIKLKVKLISVFFLKNQAGIGLNLNFSINLNILNFEIVFDNWMSIWIM
jgi:hypothetical protein